jgi:hypothetical protein
MAYTTINKSSDYFNTKLYTGNFTDNTDITGVGFQPDLVWLKERSSTSSHLLQDAVRGANKDLFSNETSDEESNTNRMKAFISDGFTLGAHNLSNQNGETYASWNWKANGAGSANTDGSISSTVSANTTNGFSIVKYTGTGSGQSNVTIGHGLGAVPKVILFKQLDTGSWIVYHHTIGKDKYLVLDTTAAEANATGICNPTSTNIVLETSYGGTNSTAGMIAYCFAEKQGFSKFGSYTGNGNADGTFVYTGFKPAFVLLKNASGTYNWNMQDNKRDTFNPVDRHLAPNLNAAEAESSNYNVDFLSNGFKLRNSLTVWNASGANHIYMAFAEAPLVGSNNVPGTAR